LIPLFKYPRTRHLEGSAIQRGDEEVEVVSFEDLAGRFLVVEEKLDGANCGISFAASEQLLLQSRGHYLMGGPRERQFELLKAWAHRHSAALWEILGTRFVMFGEWLFAKHTVFYTDLPHYFLEFDLYDKEAGLFLDTEQRSALLKGASFIASVPVVHRGMMPSCESLRSLLGPSAFIRPGVSHVLREVCMREGIAPERVLRQTDLSGLMEGLYVKWEEDGQVRGRFKYVRGGFVQALLDSDSHWQSRPIVPNQLQAGVDVFA